VVANVVYIVAAAIIFIVCVAAALGRKGALDMIKGFAVDLMFKAQKEFSDNKGLVKRSYVIDMIVNSPYFAKLPIFVRWFISSGALGNIIDKLCAAPEVRTELGKDVG